MINKVMKRNTPHLKRTLTIGLNQVNTCFTFQQVFYFATFWIGILLVHATFVYQSVLYFSHLNYSSNWHQKLHGIDQGDITPMADSDMCMPVTVNFAT